MNSTFHQSWIYRPLTGGRQPARLRMCTNTETAVMLSTWRRSNQGFQLTLVTADSFQVLLNLKEGITQSCKAEKVHR